MRYLLGGNFSPLNLWYQKNKNKARKHSPNYHFRKHIGGTRVCEKHAKMLMISKRFPGFTYLTWSTTLKTSSPKREKTAGQTMRLSTNISQDSLPLCRTRSSGGAMTPIVRAVYDRFKRRLVPPTHLPNRYTQLLKQTESRDCGTLP